MNTMTYKGYTGRFDYDPDADIFHGQILNLNDIITFQGRSIDELKKAIAESVDDYLDFCVQEGKIPEKPYSGCFNVRISPKIHQKIALEAAKEGLTLNAWISKALAKAVG